MASVTSSDVLQYVPNLIGYARVASVLIAFVLMLVDLKTHSLWWLAVGFYLFGFVGDLLDGMAARALDQTSSFGGALDMVTDRCSTLGLLYVLALEYAELDAALTIPFFRLTFLALILLDVSSHWMHVYGMSEGLHHKSDDGNANRYFLVRWFYRYYWFFGYLCVGAEFTYVALYVRPHLEPGSTVATALNVFLAACLPGCVAKQFVNIAQLTSSCVAIAQRDADMKNSKNDKKR